MWYNDVPVVLLETTSNHLILKIRLAECIGMRVYRDNEVCLRPKESCLNAMKNLSSIKKFTWISLVRRQ